MVGGPPRDVGVGSTDSQAFESAEGLRRLAIVHQSLPS